MGILPINECYLSFLEKSTKDNKTVSCDKASIFVLCSVTQAFFGGSSQPRDPGSLASPALVMDSPPLTPPGEPMYFSSIFNQ